MMLERWRLMVAIEMLVTACSNCRNVWRYNGDGMISQMVLRVSRCASAGADNA